MYKITCILLLTSVFSYAQIDYEGLIKNLEEVTAETDFSDYFKELPSTTEYQDLIIEDERFLRFYDIIIDQVTVSSRRTSLNLKFFNEVQDYEKLKKVLSEKYGEPEIDKREYSIEYEWKGDTKEILFNVKIEDGAFKSFDSLEISFITQ